jgi:hypothetical protein
VRTEHPRTTHSLIDVLDRVIDKGVRIVGASCVSLAAIELVDGGARLVLVAGEKRVRHDDGSDPVASDAEATGAD